MAEPIIDDTRRVADRLEEFEQRLGERLKQGKQNLLRHLLRLGVRERIRMAGEISLRASIKDRIKRKDGEIESISYSFERHGIYLARGVGRGRKAGSAAAKKAAKDWLTPELDLLLDDVADLIADGYADIVAAQLRINIPGFFTKVVPDKSK